MPSQFDSVELVDVPLRPAVPVGEWQPSSLAQPFLRSPLTSDEEEALRMARYRTPDVPVETSEALDLQRKVSHDAARLFEAAEDWNSARYAYLRAIELGDRDFETWRALAHVAMRSRDPALAEVAQLGALESLRESTDALLLVERRARVHRDLATLYMLEGRSADAARALQRVEGLDEPSPNLRAWLDRVRLPVVFASTHPTFSPSLDWPEESPLGVEGQVLAWTNQAYGSLPSWMQSRMTETVAWARVGSRMSTVITAGLALLGLLLLLRLIRQRGDLTVAVEYPEELRGTFRIRVGTGKNEKAPAPGSARSKILKGGPSTRYERHLVNRETQFNRLLSRRYWVVVEGMLLDPENNEILEDFSERKTVRIRHRRTVRLEVPAFPATCPVDVRTFWHESPAHDVSVALSDRPDTLMRAGRGTLRMQLPKGSHCLIVGCGDRVLEREIEVTRYQPTRVDIDLGEEAVVFKGCPPAVEPYLLGDIESVSRQLEMDGQADLGHRMLARFHREKGQPDQAAEYFESAGDLREAAAIRALERDYERAAKLLLQAEAPLEAAQMYRKAENWIQAGRCYEAARDFERAAESYREARAIDLWLSALERSGAIFDAAKIALENDRRPRAMRLLQCIAPDDEDYAEASWLLTLSFEREGHFDLAAQQLEQHIATFHRGNAPAEKYSRLADLFEQAGALERALEVLEDLRRREPTYPDVATRIELIRKQRSVSDRSRVLLGDGVLPTDAPTAFVSESRYEILEEIGRGGMGVVYRARDKRLDRVVALKRLPEDLRRHQPRAAQLFVREAQAAARLNHPHIVTVHDADQEEGHLFITMELLDGEPFNAILKEKGPLAADHLMAVAWQVASALQYAHEQGVIHRDIKTANLFLTTEDTVKVMDFGLAKMFEEVRGGTTVITGTPFYMSPEQVMGGRVDHRTDLYSLGVTLFELATGKVPFAEGDVAYHHRHTPPPDPRSLSSDLSAEMASLLLDLLEKDPENRCASAE
ncbi:MAG: protein kinase, partial [Myxococcota bacterium]|nr:protein kinase [Myxococcota bacterium]